MTIHITHKPLGKSPGPTNHRLKNRLATAIQGDVLFDPFSRGRYATDASIYQIEPIGVVVPKTLDEVRIAAEIARDEGVPLLPRGGGTSQAGQTVGRALVIDFTKHLRRVISTDFAARTCVVEPGITLDELNRQIRASGLWFPVDVSTSSRATIGGMAANNSCGTRSLRYGIMRDNVVGLDVLLADGTRVKFGATSPSPGPVRGEGRQQAPEQAAAPNPLPMQVQNMGRGDADALVADLIALGATNAPHIRQAFPAVSRRVGGYLLDALLPEAPPNLATLLLGSEGTLAITERVELRLSPLAKNRALGVCHFPTFRAAMDAAQHIVKLGPVAVELVDKNLIELARDIAMFRPVMEQFVRGRPDALLLVEFAEPEQAENLRRLDQLAALMGDLLGHANGVVKVSDAAQQTSLWGVRTAGLNIMMSMRSDGKPVSFIEDCAVPLEHLADYTERLTEIFAQHGTTGTWYAHASVGCLHVRPVLNLKLDQDAKTMRSIAEAAFTLVKEYKGSHSGEHGDGLVRSEFHELMYGRKTVELFETVKDRFDPAGLMNPGKIVRAPAMNDRTLFRYKPDYMLSPLTPQLDWSGYVSGANGLQGAVEMCNNNGECRKTQGGGMCPSFRVTRDEKDSTRGRANTLRLALSGQLGPDALGSDAMLETMKLCVSCKACRSECPTGVDMAKMKIEVLAAANARRGLSLRDRLVGYLPRYAAYARKFAVLLNLRDKLPGAAKLSELITGLSAKRRLPVWQSDAFMLETAVGPANGREVAFFADTFNSNFEPQTLRDAVDVLVALGYRVTQLHSEEGRRVCCGRTFLSAGLVAEARHEARRFMAAVRPFVARGVPVVGLEPSCMMSFRDEVPGLLPGPETKALMPLTFLFEEFLAAEMAAGRIKGPLAVYNAKVLLHGHCHQKSFGAMPATLKALSLVQGLDVALVESSCCGMAGSFGYQAETHSTSVAMAELSLLPAVRASSADTIIAADGFSCRHQIADGTARRPRHVASILRDALAAGQGAAVASGTEPERDPVS
jgi:FAD/FMN-containing dehydrogenase/Fe-S oxidoreductase